MNFNDLTIEEIKEEIIKKLLYKTEFNKEIVDRQIKYCEIYKYHGTYCLNFFNGYEHKVVSVDNKKAFISSESLQENDDLTKFYRSLLKTVLYKKAQEELVI